jgi:hypothetical protein
MQGVLNIKVIAFRRKYTQILREVLGWDRIDRGYSRMVGKVLFFNLGSGLSMIIHQATHFWIFSKTFISQKKSF